MLDTLFILVVDENEYISGITLIDFLKLPDNEYVPFTLYTEYEDNTVEKEAYYIRKSQINCIKTWNK